MRLAERAAYVGRGAMALTATFIWPNVACEPPPFEKCEAPEADGAFSAENSAAQLTYHRDVGPIVAARCARCHAEVGIAPFPLTSFDQLREHLPAVRDAVVSRRMPPWLPARCCNTYVDDASLTPEQIAMVVSWIDAGAPEGDPADVGPALPAVGTLPRVDATLTVSEPYLPDVQAHDETRCFLLDWPIAGTNFIVGMGVVPGERSLVHHALVVTAPGSAREGLRSLEDEDSEPGWTCPGGLVLGIDNLLGGYAPGSDGQRTPPGTGHRMDEDDVVVLTVHYRKPASGDVAPDQSSIDVMVEEAVDDELMTITALDPAWLVGGMPIPAGEEDVVHSVDYDPTSVSLQPTGVEIADGTAITLVGVHLHMHEHGTSGVVGIRRKDGTDECLVQADDFDHAWEGDYTFAEPTIVAPGDRVYVECHFDNSHVHEGDTGEAAEPHDLNWGDEGEMCIGFLTALKP